MAETEAVAALDASLDDDEAAGDGDGESEEEELLELQAALREFG